MIKIVLAIPSLGGGGAEKVFSLIAKYLDRSQYEVIVLVLNLKHAVFEKDLPQDVELINLNVDRVRFALPKLIWKIWQIRPDILFSTLWYLNLGLAIFKFFLPKHVHLIARETSIVSQRIKNENQSKIWPWMYRKFYKRIPNIVCQSQVMRSDLVQNFSVSNEKVVVINNPVDIEKIRQLAAEPCEFFAQKKLMGKTIFVAVGRLSRAKGFDVLIDAFAILKQSDLHLIIVGAGNLAQKLQNHVSSHGLDEHISFVGFQDNPYKWMANAHAFVFSSRYEGFPNVALEALACRVPVITLPSPGGLNEILDGVDGCFIAENMSSKALATVMKSWLVSRRLRVSPDVVDKFSVQKIIKIYSDYFQNVVQS